MKNIVCLLGEGTTDDYLAAQVEQTQLGKIVLSAFIFDNALRHVKSSLALHKIEMSDSIVVINEFPSDGHVHNQVKLAQHLGKDIEYR